MHHYLLDLRRAGPQLFNNKKEAESALAFFSQFNGPTEAVGLYQGNYYVKDGEVYAIGKEYRLA